MTNIKTKEYWLDFAEKNLIGKVIKKVFYLNEIEAKRAGFDSIPLIITFDDNSYIYASMDESGHEGATIFGQSKNGEYIFFPTM